jgi:hypothetical protein
VQPLHVPPTQVLASHPPQVIDLPQLSWTASQRPLHQVGLDAHTQRTPSQRWPSPHGLEQSRAKPHLSRSTLPHLSSQ